MRSHPRPSCAWRGRWVKEDLQSCVSEGFISTSWNGWVDAKKGKRDLAGVPVERLECYLQEHNYLLCPDGTEEQLEQRDSLINITGKGESPHIKKEIEFWKGMAGTLVSNLYAFRQAVKTIGQRYFDGEQVMFSDSAESLADLEKHTEDLIIEFNDHVAKESEDKINIEALRQGANRSVVGQVSYLVDMAKAEALDALGENQAAIELIARHLGL